MKSLIVMLALVFSTQALAQEPTPGRVGVREQYDDLMKQAGKWDFLQSGSIWAGIATGTVALYSYNRSLYYRDLKKDRELSTHEKSEFEMWDTAANNAGYGAGAFLCLAIWGSAVEVHYENKAHAFALDMGVKF